MGERTRVPFPFCFIVVFKPKCPPCIFSEELKCGYNNNKKGALISSWPLPSKSMEEGGRERQGGWSVPGCLPEKGNACVPLWQQSSWRSQWLAGLPFNVSNTFVVDKFLSTMFPVSLVLMELSFHLAKMEVSLSLQWIPREQNEEADDL